MPLIVTAVHDPVALTATCRRIGIPPIEQGSVQLDDQEPFGWIVHLPGVHFPIVCDTLTGLVTYHPRDNFFDRYARIMRFIYRYYDVQALQQRVSPGMDIVKPMVCQSRHPVLMRQTG